MKSAVIHTPTIILRVPPEGISKRFVKLRSREREQMYIKTG